ncbi:hypothetical protein LPU83_0804 [Rhizobium favelukesii]|uniref:Uncharacterized protein n=2 Tax=Rhizobium/Agrobacterium group TaxID=227290 RepID=W6R5E0_9HYPH|nr:hypothetical protein LPU83_0804 [Rhizobium favelukesii]
MPKPQKQPDASRSDDKKSREELLAELNSLRMENAFLKLDALTLEQAALKKRKSSKR